MVVISGRPTVLDGLLGFGGLRLMVSMARSDVNDGSAMHSGLFQSLPTPAHGELVEPSATVLRQAQDERLVDFHNFEKALPCPCRGTTAGVRMVDVMVARDSSHDHGNLMELNITVNGNPVAIHVQQYWSLLDVLRDSLGLTGAKRGCDRGECGSCTVLLDGKPVNACQVLASRVDGGANVATIEGLASGGMLSELQQSYLDEDGGQCGFCTPGFVMATRALLNTNPTPTDDEIREALSGNLCRCNAYGRILASVRTAIEREA